MKAADAPAAGWYPDPAGRSGLRWWDGLDWTDHRRAPVTSMPELHDPPPPTRDAASRSSAAGATSLGSALDDVAGRTLGASRDATAEMMAEVRRVTRDEVERAVGQATQRVTDASRRFQPMVTEYGDRFLKGLRTAFIVVVVLAVLWMVLSTVGQTSLLEFIGDRIDNLTDGVVRVAPPPGPTIP